MFERKQSMMTYILEGTSTDDTTDETGWDVYQIIWTTIILALFTAMLISMFFVFMKKDSRIY